MDTHARQVAHEMAAASQEERIVFPDVVKALMEAGIERYHVDFSVGTHTYFMPDGSYEAMQTRHTYQPAADFDSAGVQKALRGIQAGEFQYLEFCKRVAAAGCVGYMVSLVGKRALYYGRNNDLYIEWFPGAKP